MKPLTMNFSDKTITIDKSPWFKNWFDSSFYHRLYANRDEKEASDFIEELIAELQPLPGSAMLDLGCGNGRHSRKLARNAFNVTGIDLAASSIAMARKSEHAWLHFYRHDMRKSFGHNQYDYVFNFFTSFGYFNSDEENHQVLSNISHSLKQNGILVMDYLNVQYSEESIRPIEEKEIDGVIYQISRWMTDTHFHKKITIDTNTTGKVLEYTEQVAKFSLSDFNYMFLQHGLCIEKVYGDYGLGKYDSASSPRLIMIARKS